MKERSFQRLSKLPTYVFAQINEWKAQARAAGLDVIDLGMGNPDGPSPEPVVNALCAAAHDGRNHGYSQGKGIPALRQAIAGRYKRNYGVTLDPDTEVVATIGAKESLAHLFYAILGPGDGVVTAAPAYPIHVYGVLFAGGESLPIPWTNAANFLDAVETYAKRPGTKGVVICFPHNPTTATVEPGFFTELIALAHRYGFWIVHDFAYADLGFDGYKPPSFLAAEGAREVGVEIFSLSKSYNMAGWRVGFCAGNRELVGALTRIKSYLDYGSFQPIQIAASVALNECDNFVSVLRETYRRRRDVLVDGLQKQGWAVERPRASMFVWAPIPSPWNERGSLEFSRRLLLESGVAVSPGVGFGEEGEGYVRFGLVQDETRLAQALKAMERVMSRKAVPV